MPTAAITGDVHHYLGNHQMEKKEYLFAEEYINTIKNNNAKATLFVTGKAIEEHPEHWKKLSENAEIGGHTYYALQPPTVFYAYRDLLSRFGHTYAPILYQIIDISKTVKAFKNADIPMNSWRTHGYRGDKVTGKLLPDFGIKFISEIKKVPSEQLTNLPITCYPDDHIFLATKDVNRYNEHKEIKMVKESIYNNIEEKNDLILQLHPGSMKVYDDFQTLKNILIKLKTNDYDFKTITEMGNKFKDGLEESPDALKYYYSD